MVDHKLHALKLFHIDRKQDDIKNIQYVWLAIKYFKC